VNAIAPRIVTRDQLAGAAEAALGGGRRLERVERLTGGTRKGVYRLAMDDATSAIAYLWEEADALTWGLRCLTDAATRDPRITNAHDQLGRRLHGLAAAISPRAEYSVVHGELGLDHVLVDRRGRPVIIDVEDLMYYDVEWEHVFLRLRLHADYHHVAVDGLDEARLALYMLVQRLSLTAGPLRLLETDFPDREFFRGIVEHNLREALLWLSEPTSPARIACCSRQCWPGNS